MILCHCGRISIILITCFLGCYAKLISSVKNVSVIQVQAIVGEPAYLPCDVSTNAEDDVLLVLWFRENVGAPIYSIDGRNRGFKYAERWSDDNVFSNRAYFMLEKNPAELGIDRIRESDEGVYRCRVDFRIAKTRNSIISLKIIVPPEKILITNELGVELKSVVGPLLENQSVVLNCDVFGGKPIPRVKWFRNKVDIEAENKLVESKTVDSVYVVRSQIQIRNVTRQDLNTELSCQAENNNRNQLLKASLYIDMNFPPTSVQIKNKRPVAANRMHKIVCQSSGSRPSPTISWWLNGLMIENSKSHVIEKENLSISTLEFIPNKNDDGLHLSCRSENHLVSNFTYIEDFWKLQIHYIPQSKIMLGRSLNANEIREGTDVYFDCIIDAYPVVYKVEWKHKGQILSHNVSHGIIITNQSLVLQGISRKTAGNYSCVGYNSEGVGESSQFYLNIYYVPQCKQQQTSIVGVSKNEDASIKCEVESNPAALSFKWLFNNSNEKIDLHLNSSTQFGSTSAISYRPRSDSDYGTLLCWAVNQVGHQVRPCVFYIIAAGKPDHVHNCTLSNISMTSLSLECNEGFSGGLTQLFYLEIYEKSDRFLKKNLTSSTPRFKILNLDAGITYQMLLFSYNNKGISEPFFIETSTLRLPEKHLISDQGKSSKVSLKLISATNVLIGFLTITFVMLLLYTVLWRVKCLKRENKPLTSTNDDSESHFNYSTSTFQIVDSVDKNQTKSRGQCHDNSLTNCFDYDENNPDLIPNALDGQYLQPNRCHSEAHPQFISTIEVNSNRVENIAPICFQYYSPSNCLKNHCSVSSLNFSSGPSVDKQWHTYQPNSTSTDTTISAEVAMATSTTGSRHLKTIRRNHLQNAHFDRNLYSLQPIIVLNDVSDSVASNTEISL